jgi:glycosyltransferase involved in cell wall biosynthesis
MKIAIVAPFFTPFVKSNEYWLATHLARAGHDVHFITSSAKAPREYNKHTGVLALPFQVRYVKTITTLKENPIVLSLREHLDNSYDAFLLQEDYPLICHIAFHYARKHRIPSVVSCERYYYPQDIFKRLPLQFFDKTVNRSLWNGCNLITTHTHAAKAFLSEIGADKTKISVIPTGVDTQSFVPVDDSSFREKHGIGTKLLILTVARLHPYKGLTYLIQSMEQVVSKNKGVHLIILGKGSQEEALRSLIVRLNLQDYITIDTEVISNEKMPAIYSSADLYVQPSIIEPFGISVVEAMSCSKPVIGAAVGGMLDTVVDNQTGFIVPPTDVHQLADRISCLCEKHKLREDFGEKGRERTLSIFDWTVVARQYENAISRIMRQH